MATSKVEYHITAINKDGKEHDLALGIEFNDFEEFMRKFKALKFSCDKSFDRFEKKLFDFAMEK